MELRGATVGIVGALAAFPRRLAARAVADQGGQLRRGITRATSHVVFGRKLLDTWTTERIEGQFAAVRDAGSVLLSEAGFLRALGLSDAPPGADISRRSLIDQAGLAAHDLDLLTMFDAFEQASEPYAFRDLILAKKYARLIVGGAGWDAIARSIHRTGDVASITALTLEAGTPGAIYSKSGEALHELDGQGLLPLFETIESDHDEPADADDLFAAAEAAEAEGDVAAAAELYARCLAVDPDDSVAAYNRANCLKAADRPDEAARSYTLALKLDPEFVEAWFNFAGLLGEGGKTAEARRHLSKAILLDPTYADAVYNLAALEYDAGRLADARQWWTRYLDLDSVSDWAAKARRGIKYIDMQLRSAGRAG